MRIGDLVLAIINPPNFKLGKGKIASILDRKNIEEAVERAFFINAPNPSTSTELSVPTVKNKILLENLDIEPGIYWLGELSFDELMSLLYDLKTRPLGGELEFSVEVVFGEEDLSVRLKTRGDYGEHIIPYPRAELRQINPKDKWGYPITEYDLHEQPTVYDVSYIFIRLNGQTIGMMDYPPEGVDLTEPLALEDLELETALQYLDWETIYEPFDENDLFSSPTMEFVDEEENALGEEFFDAVASPDELDRIGRDLVRTLREENGIPEDLVGYYILARDDEELEKGLLELAIQIEDRALRKALVSKIYKIVEQSKKEGHTLVAIIPSQEKIWFAGVSIPPNLPGADHMEV